MRPIPPTLRQKISADPFMSTCIYSLISRSNECRHQFGGPGIPEWEHCHLYANRQINEQWAIVPACWFHHRGPGLDKRFNQYISLRRATKEDLKKYPKINWEQLQSSLHARYKNLAPIVPNCQ